MAIRVELKVPKTWRKLNMTEIPPTIPESRKAREALQGLGDRLGDFFVFRKGSMMGYEYPLEKTLQHDITFDLYGRETPVIVRDLVPREMWQHCDVSVEAPLADGSRMDILIKVFSPHGDLGNGEVLGFVIVELKRGELKVADLEQVLSYQAALSDECECAPIATSLIGGSCEDFDRHFPNIMNGTSCSVGEYDLNPFKGLRLDMWGYPFVVSDEINKWVDDEIKFLDAYFSHYGYDG